MTVANLVRDQGALGAMGNAITFDYVSHGICRSMGAARIMSIAVWPPNPETHLFLLGSNSVNGSGIREVSAEGSI